ncbi:MAG: nirA, partial [Dehalococcoidia bacterium]|nr:nirA [Dehalococcoidia bacterium]
LIETKELAMETAKALEERLGDTAPFTMYWSGCPAGCGNHHVADIGLEGKRVRINGEIVDAVDIYMGGRSGAEPSLSTKVMENVPCSDLPDIVMGLLGQQDRLAPEVAVGKSLIQEPVVAMAL